jgi:tetratricopeptide (TPR) repeat protein
MLMIVDRGIDPTLQTLVADDNSTGGGSDARAARTEPEGAAIDTAILTQLDQPDLGRPLVEPGEDNDDELMPGEFIGRYVIIDVLGRGGMGVVYSAYDSDLHRQLAIKLLRLVGGGSLATEGHQRLIREAQSLAGLAHPNVITVHDVGEHERQVFVAMEMVEGVTLREYCEAHAGDWTKILEAYLQGGRGLAAAHDAGLIHRDFKPENVLVGDDGRVRVLDFGLARAASPGAASTEVQRGGDTNLSTGRVAPRPSGSSLTRTGAIMGTPAYMSPEQHLGTTTDPRTDQFSFCVALFEGLSGARPYHGTTAIAVAEAVLQGEPRLPPKNSDVPTAVWKVLRRGLSREVEDRWPSMQAMLVELEQALTPGVGARWQIFAGVAALGVVVGTIATGAGQSETPEAAPVIHCEEAGAPVDERWDRARGDELAAAFTQLGEGLPTQAGKRTREVLDTYATSLREAFVTRCEAERAGGEVTAAMHRTSACLQERNEELGMLVQALSEPTSSTVQSAVPAALSLTAVARCTDAGAAPAFDAAPPELRERVARRRSELASAAALHRSGRFDEAKAALAAVVESSREVGFAPLLADALLEFGRVLASTGDPQAEKVLKEAVSTAELGRYDGVVVRASTVLVRVVGIQAAHHAQGQQWAERAGDVLARMPADPDLQSRLYTARGRLALSVGDVSTAKEAHAKALETAAAVEPPDPLRIAEARSHLGDAQTDAGDHDAAIESFTQALVELESQLGSEHPGLARTLNGLGNVYDALGRMPHALGQYQRALDLRESAFGPEHPDVAGTRVNLARVLLDMGELEEARGELERARRSFEAAFGPEHPGVGLALETLAHLEQREGNLELARRHVRAALVIQGNTASPDHPHRAALLTHLGELLHMQGEGAKAVGRLEQANALLDADEAPAGLRAHTKLALARVLHAERVDPQRARQLALEARKLISGPGSLDSGALAAVDEFLRSIQ